MPRLNLAWYWVVLIIIGIATLSYYVPMWYKKMMAKNASKNNNEEIEEAEATIAEAEKRMRAAA